MHKNKPQFDLTRPLSWSAISAFEYDKEAWFRRYIIGDKDRATPELAFGKVFADSCEARKPLAPVRLLSKVENEFKTTFNDIPLVGYADTFCKETHRKIGEFKTGVKTWDQKRVDNHGQITMYAFLNYLINKVNPEECEFYLEWVPTKKVPRENGDFSGDDYTIEFVDPVEVKSFKTKRTMKDILTFASYIKRIYKEMQEYAAAHP